MKLFLNDIKINIKKDGTTVKTADFDYIFSTFEKINPSEWNGSVLLLFPSVKVSRTIFDALESGIAEGVKKIVLICHKPKEFVAEVFKDFSFIEAGGGIVNNAEGKFLMIYRNGIWDFPKGKLDKGEKIIDCAEREVEEECGVKVKAKSLICKTKHTYVGSKKRILKTTFWYKMDLISDAKMKPQLNEGIEKVEWKTAEEVDGLLGDSFASLRYLFNKSQGLKGTYALTSLPNL
jgi:8-oxo-dGTP pyrophosphatase MutT (NUDIX family)